MHSCYLLLPFLAVEPQVYLITIPPSTEHPCHDANIRIARMTSLLQQLVLNYPVAELVDFNAACVSHLQMHSKVWQQAAGDDCSQAQTERMHKFSLISGGWLMGTAVLQRYWLHRAWDDISRARGLHLLTDQVHLNDTAAALLAAQLEPLMQRLGKQEQL
jgi:hypothetical protein